MRAVFTGALFLVLAITISCGGGSASQNNGMAQIRVLQASVDIGNVDVVVNGKQIATNLGWGAEFPLPTTTYTTIQAGNLRFEEFPTATTSTPSLSTQYSISPNTYYTILPMGEKSTGSLASIIFPDDHVPPPTGGFRVRLVNAASTVDGYISHIQPQRSCASVTHVSRFWVQERQQLYVFHGNHHEYLRKPRRSCSG